MSNQQQQPVVQQQYQPQVGQEWYGMTPTISIEQLINELHDIQPLEHRYEWCKMQVEYGLVDFYRSVLDALEAPNTEGIKAKLTAIETDMRSLEQRINDLHQQNSRKVLEAGYGQINAPTIEQATAYQTPNGTFHQQGGQNYYSQGQTYGQPGYAEQPAHPSLGQLGWGLASRFAGVPPAQQQQQRYY